MIILIIIIFILAVIISNTSIPNKKIYANGIVLFAIGFIILATFFFIRQLELEDTDIDSYTPTAEGFTIESYDVILDVNKNNEINVTEKIVTDWYESGHHGIYKFTPIWLKYTGKDGKTISRKSEIYDLEAIGEEYVIDTVKNKERIKIGNPNTTLNYGTHEYIIKYIYNMGNDPFKDFDEFIFHAYGDYWGTEIKNASITINMPESFDPNKIKFFDDKYRKNDITKYIDYKVNGNTISAKVSNNYELYKSLTVDIELPDNYFEYGQDNYGITSLILCIIIILFAIISFFNWKKYGKDYDKISQTVEFYPPENLDASEIGYIYGKENTKKLTISLIIELASKGFIKIDEDEKKDRVITKVEKNNQFSNMTKNERCVYDNLFISGNKTHLNVNTTFYQAFDIIGNNLNNNLDEKIRDTNSYKKMKSTSIMFLIGTILWLLSYSIFEDLNPKLKILYSVSFIALFIIALFMFLMTRKTTYGEMITSKVLGFKNYLETAEKDKIEKLVMENPNYFYDILPYAYVLGVSKKWIEKFEDIPIPENNMGNFDYTSMDSFNDLSESIYTPSDESSSSGGCSSCGGGCSSCGGGCSSCGGGGSW